MAYESCQSLSENNCFIDSTLNDANSKNSYRMVVLGAPKVGKSSILNWFLGKKVEPSYVPTIEDFHKKVFKIRGDVFRLDILDTSGNDPFPAMKKLNIMTGDIFILVFSLDNVESYTQVKSLLQLIVELKKPSSKPENGRHSTSVLVVGNKLDLLTENKITSRCVELGDIQQMVASTAGPKTAVYTEISALNGMGIETAFERLFSLASLPLEMLPQRHRTVDLNLSGSVAPASASGEQKNSVMKTESISNIDSSATAPEIGSNPILGKRFSTKLSNGFARASSLKLRKLTHNNSLNSSNNNGDANSTAPTTTTTTTTTSSSRTTINGGNGENTFKLAARKSFRKVTFRRAAAAESWGAVWLNARRPSIRAELKLLQVKKSPNTTFKYHDYESASSSSSSPTAKNTGGVFSSKFTFSSSTSSSSHRSNSMSNIGSSLSNGTPGTNNSLSSSSSTSASTRNKFRMLVDNFKNLVCSSDRSIKSSKIL